MQKLRSAFRNLARSPGFTTVAIVVVEPWTNVNGGGPANLQIIPRGST